MPLQVRSCQSSRPYSFDSGNPCNIAVTLGASSPWSITRTGWKASYGHRPQGRLFHPARPALGLCAHFAAVSAATAAAIVLRTQRQRLRRSFGWVQRRRQHSTQRRAARRRPAQRRIAQPRRFARRPRVAGDAKPRRPIRRVVQLHAGRRQFHARRRGAGPHTAAAKCAKLDRRRCRRRRSFLRQFHARRRHAWWFHAGWLRAQ